MMTTNIMIKAAPFGLIIGILAFLLATSTPAAASTDSSAKKMRDQATTTKEVKDKRTVNLSCMATAVETRETKLATAWANFNTSISTALAVRKIDLVAAWNTASSSAKSRNSSTNTAWKKWKDSSKQAHATLRTERKAAWEDFRKTAKDECRTTLPREEALERTSSDTLAL